MKAKLAGLPLFVWLAAAGAIAAAVFIHSRRAAAAASSQTANADVLSGMPSAYLYSGGGTPGGLPADTLPPPTPTPTPGGGGAGTTTITPGSSGAGSVFGDLGTNKPTLFHPPPPKPTRTPGPTSPGVTANLARAA